MLIYRAKKGTFIMEKTTSELREYYTLVREYLDKIIIGEGKAKDVIAASLLCDKNSRMLLVGCTGSGKTTLAKCLAKNFISKRISITADLLPSDIINIIKDEKDLQYLLLEEFNRTTGKSLSSVIELLAENQITFDKETTQFDDFYAMATQNGTEAAGIWTVPQAVYDRFDIIVKFGNLTREEKESVIFDYQQPTDEPLENLHQIINAVSDEIDNFVFSPEDRRVLMDSFEIIDNTKRDNANLFPGTNIRASIFAKRLAAFHALINGRRWIEPLDLTEYITNLYLHRIDQTILKMTDAQALEKMQDIEEAVLNNVKRKTTIAYGSSNEQEKGKTRFLGQKRAGLFK